MAEAPKPTGNESSRSRIQVPAILETVRVRSLQRLSDLLKGMFDRMESILYEWSRDLTDAEQQHYMDVIVVMRTRRPEMEGVFSSTLLTNFNSVLQPRQEKAAAGIDSVDFSQLSLVDTDEMDISVTMDSMVAKARLDYAAELGLLRRRFSHVLPKVEVLDRNMPLDPGAIAEAFKTALRLADGLGVQERVVVLRIFQQQVLRDLAVVLDEANQLFIEAGVLPDLKLAFSGSTGKPSASARAAARAEAEGQARKPHGDTEEAFSFLQEMLAMGRGSMGSGMPQGSGASAGQQGSGGAGLPQGAQGAGGGGQPFPGGQYHGGHYVGGGGIGMLPAQVIGGSVASVPIAPQHIAPTAVVQTVATPELLALLSGIQQMQPRAPLAEDASTPTVGEVRGAIRDNLKSDDETVEAIKQADEDIINLVSMLFDFILDDDDLPTAMKALIGRLQIPLLKVAILDKTFFNAESHSARRLLNALAKAGIGWSSHEQGSDALYAKIEEVVFRILNEFIDDISLFDDLLEEFTSFHEHQQRREEAVDTRTREAEEGRARAELARAMVQQTLNRRLTGRQLPIVVVRLLQDAWRNVLYINCLKEGTESEAWRQAVKVVDAVIWSVLPQAGDEWQKRHRDVAPKLMNSLKKGLAAVNYDPLNTETLLRELAQVHLGLLQGQSARTVTIVDASTAPLSAPGQVQAENMQRADDAKVESVVLPQAEPVPPPPEDLLPGDNEHVLTVSRLNVGSWVEFCDAEQRDRNKLVARIRSVDKLIFANRRGIKVGEMTAMKLAQDMSLGRARVVEESEFIDRALESVIGNLRDLSGKQAPARQ